MSELEIIQLCIISTIVLFLIVFYGIKAIKNKWVGKLVSSVKEACKVAVDTIKGINNENINVLFTCFDEYDYNLYYNYLFGREKVKQNSK